MAYAVLGKKPPKQTKTKLKTSSKTPNQTHKIRLVTGGKSLQCWDFPALKLIKLYLYQKTKISGQLLFFLLVSISFTYTLVIIKP